MIESAQIHVRTVQVIANLSPTRGEGVMRSVQGGLNWWGDSIPVGEVLQIDRTYLDRVLW
jgi:hypothetical protein